MKNLLLLFMLIGISLGSYAEVLHPALETDRENVALARIDQLLHRITPLIEEAKRYQNPHARVQFRYDVLAQDIHHIQSGIAQAFHPELQEPRTIPPIQGDYLQFKRKSHE